VGGASLEMHRGRKIEYLDIPLKDNIKGWRLEWFIIENHGKSLPPRSGRQPDVHTPSWIESPTTLEITEARVLLDEFRLLKERGLTAEAVVADFVFKNIQLLKDRAHPAYLYSGATDSTRVTDKRIPTVDLVSRMEMILRGKVSNIGAPVAYSAWNLPSSKPFFSFVSNPPAGDSALGLRVRPSPEEVEALVASLCGLPNDEKQVHFEIPTNSSDAEIGAMLDMLAGDSSDSALAETVAAGNIPEPEKAMDARRPEGTRPKRLRQVSHPTAPAEGKKKKKKKRRLQRVSCLDHDAGPSAPAAEEVPVELFTRADPNGCDPMDADPNGCDPAEADPNGCGPAETDPNGCGPAKTDPNECDPAEADPNGCGPAKTNPNGCGPAETDPNECDPARADPNGCIVRIVDEGEEEEEEIPLIRKNSRRYIVSGESSDIPSPALSALIGLQELSLANFDQALEDVVPEDLLSEPIDGGMMDVCSDIPDVGLELSRAASRASSTLECSLRGQEASQGCSIPMEVAAAENPVPKDSANGYPAPEGVAGNDPARVGSASYSLAPRVLPGVIRLRWAMRAATQPPRVSARAPLLISP
jgi:hypothetical protein